MLITNPNANGLHYAVVSMSVLFVLRLPLYLSVLKGPILTHRLGTIPKAFTPEILIEGFSLGN